MKIGAPGRTNIATLEKATFFQCLCRRVIEKFVAPSDVLQTVTGYEYNRMVLTKVRFPPSRITVIAREN